MKKTIMVFVAIAMMLCAQAQNNMTILMDSVRKEMHMAYCKGLDYIRIIPPDSSTKVSWIATNFKTRIEGDHLILLDPVANSNYGDELYCAFSKKKDVIEKQYIVLHMLSVPTEPKFTDCTIYSNESVTLTADIDFDPWGFTKYLWSTGSTQKQIVVSSSGTYTVTVTNPCGSITHSAKITVIPAKEKKITSGSNKVLRDPKDVKKKGFMHWWLVWKYEHL